MTAFLIIFIFQFVATGNWYSTGIVCQRFECARPNRYGIYADVAYFKDWITETILTKFSNADEK